MASDMLTFWYLWTAIIAALLVILPGLGKGANGLVRLARFLHNLAKVPERMATLRTDFTKHASDDLAFQEAILRRLEELAPKGQQTP